VLIPRACILEEYCDLNNIKRKPWRIFNKRIAIEKES